MNDPLSLDQTIDALRAAASHLATTWDEARDARRDGRPADLELQRAYKLAVDIAVLGAAAEHQLGRVLLK